jgi:hypothetical protein
MIQILSIGKPHPIRPKSLTSLPNIPRENAPLMIMQLTQIRAEMQ